MPICVLAMLPALTSVLICPVCSAKLADVRACGSCGTPFLQAGDHPVLIDFDDSIFRPEEYAGAATPSPRLRQGSGIGRFLRELTYGDNRRAAINIKAFIDRLGRAAARPRVLVVGGGTVGKGMDALYDSGAIEVVGVDVYQSPRTVLICDGHKLPFADSSFDGCVIQAVLQDCVEPKRVVTEIHRVLRPGGLVYAETPFLQQVYDGAYDFTRFTLSGHRWLFKDFAEIDAGLLLGPGYALMGAIFHYIAALGASQRLAAILTAPFFWLRMIGERARGGSAADAASGFYFLGARSDTPMRVQDLPAYYGSKR